MLYVYVENYGINDMPTASVETQCCMLLEIWHKYVGNAKNIEFFKITRHEHSVSGNR